VIPFSIALIPALAHTSGVSKSGSPAASPMTSSPRSFSVLARSVRATVFDSFKFATRGFNDWSTPPATTFDEEEEEGEEGEEPDALTTDSFALSSRFSRPPPPTTTFRCWRQPYPLFVVKEEEHLEVVRRAPAPLFQRRGQAAAEVVTLAEMHRIVISRRCFVKRCVV